jgi:hypothetical protein
MHFTSTVFTAIIGLVAVGQVSGAAIQARQNQNRPVPTGACCVANTSLKQDTCTTADGATGRCVPGGEDCKLISTIVAYVLPLWWRIHTFDHPS